MKRFYEADSFVQAYNGKCVTFDVLERSAVDKVQIPDYTKKQFNSVAYCDETKKVILYRPYDEKTKTREREHRDEFDVQDLLDTKFLNQIKHHWDKNVLFDLKVGNAISSDSYDEDTTLPKVHYQQGENPYCLACSFASTLFYKGFERESSTIFNSRKTLHECIDALNSIRKLLHNCLPPKFRVVVLADEHFTFDPLTEKDISGVMSLLILEASDGGRQHSISIVDGLIFDSNRKHAMKLNKVNLDWCCYSDSQKSELKRIYRALGVFEMPVKLLEGNAESKKVSTIQNSLAALFHYMGCYSLREMFLAHDQETFNVMKIWNVINMYFQEIQDLKGMQLQRPKKMTDGGKFVYEPSLDIRIVLFKVDTRIEGGFHDTMGAVLLGHWLFDCRQSYPTYVYENCDQMKRVFNVRKIVFLKRGEEMKKKFDNMLNEMSFLKYAL